MAITLEELNLLMDEAAEALSSDSGNWRSFLDTCSNLYKFDFANQMAIYCQKPDATICAGMYKWNNVGRYVKRNSTAIRLFVPGQFSEGNFVFDISSTVSASEKEMFDVWADKTLIEKYYQSEETDVKELLKRDIRELADQTFMEHTEKQTGSMGSDDFTPEYFDRVSRLNELVLSSAEYIVLKRCGMIEDDADYEFDVSVLDSFKSYLDLAETGELIASPCKELLSDISNIAKDELKKRLVAEKEKRNETTRHSIQTGRGISDSGYNRTRTAERGSRQVRTNEGRIPEKEQQTSLFGTSLQDGNEAAPSGHRPSDERNDRGSDQKTSESKSGTEQRGHSGMDGTSGADSKSGRGNSLEGNSIQISMFPSQDEQIAIIEENIEKENTDYIADISLKLNQNIVDAILREAGDGANSRIDIYNQYRKGKTIEEMSHILPHIFVGRYAAASNTVEKGRGRGYIVSGREYSTWADGDSFKISMGKQARYSNHVMEISWEEVAERIGTLLDEGNFLTEGELSRADERIYTQISEKICFMLGDMNYDISGSLMEKSRQFRREGKGFFGGIFNALKDQESYLIIMEELREFVEASKEKDYMRFRFYRPETVIGDVSELSLLNRKEYSANEEIATDFERKFITQDAIDAEISKTGMVSEYANKVYKFFSESHTAKEKEEFLRAQHGIGGRSGPDMLGLSYDAKGIKFKEKSCDEIFYTYSQLAKRIEKLIKSGHFAVGKTLQNEVSDEKDNEPINEKTEAESVKLSHTFNEEYLHKILHNENPETKHTYYEVIRFFRENDDFISRVEFLKEHFGTAYTSFFADADKTKYIGFKAHEEGFEVWEDNYLTTTSKDKYTWDEICDIYEKESAENAVILRSDKQASPELKDIDNLNERDYTFEYRLLERLRSDCEYFLGEGMRAEKHLWAGNVTAQIDKMWELYNEVTEKPEWFTKEQIESYQERMMPPPPAIDYTEGILVPAENYRILDGTLTPAPKRERFKRNIDAIKVLKKCELEGRAATKDEQDILAKYAGWGGIPEAFDPRNDSWSNEYKELKALLLEDEYSSAMESVLNSHYTDPVIINSIYNVLGNLGFEKGNILEPAMGVGNFFGTLPQEMSESNLYGIELDSVTGRIAKLLYPDAKISICGFEETTFPDNSFDVVIGNVPFGNYQVNDRKYNSHGFKIHDYFFAKALDKVRPGGVVAFITSKGTLDKKSSSVRKYLAERADLLGAIRLPNTAFKANAGTEVTSDIIFLQKREAPTVVENTTWTGLSADDNGLIYNQYFVDNPDMIVGSMKEVSGPYGMQLTCELDNQEEFSELLKRAANKIHGQITEVEFTDLEEEGSNEDVIPADADAQNFAYCMKDGKIYYRENSKMRLVKTNNTALKRIEAMIELKDALRTLINQQLEDYSDDEIMRSQVKLNDLYDAFSKKYGLINDRANRLAFTEDSSYPLLCSLENLDEDGSFESKADIFFKRTIRKKVYIDKADSAADALALSLGNKARINFEYMQSLTGMSKEALISDLKGVIFRVPDFEGREEYQTADEYLSGNIRKKLAAAKIMADRDPEYKENVKALENAMPKPLEATEIEVRIGATWVPEKYYLDFIKDLLKPSWFASRYLDVQYEPRTGVWRINGKGNDTSGVLANSTYGTKRASAYRLFEDALNLRTTKITDLIVDENGNEKRVTNNKETTLAVQKQDLIKDKFKEWIFKDIERREELCRIYNEKFNSIVPREFNGDHLQFPGMNEMITLKPHQKKAVARQLYGGNTLLAHCVGAGKTYEIITAVMEKKRLGLANKAMIVVPNHLTGQWAKEFMKLYPEANILAVEKKDFTPHARKKFCSRIATGEYDAVIIGHSQFEKIPLSVERQEIFIRRQLDDILSALERENIRTSGDSFTVKELKQKERELETKLERLLESGRKDNTIDFEELGIDFLCVDEAHNYKNLGLQTKLRNVAGISTNGANKSFDMFSKCHYMDEITGGRGITFATGTPISNSMAELYTMQKYLQYNVLRENDLLNFDAWASTFGEVQTVFELTPEGNGYRQKTRFARFFNLPELMSMFKECADIVTSDMIKLPVPNAHHHNIVLKPSLRQQHIIEELGKRASEVRKGNVEPEDDNMLKITNEGRKLALDERLIEGYELFEEQIGFDLNEEETRTKVQACVDECIKYYDKSADIKGTQLVFCDLSTPKADGSFNVYDEVKRGLIGAGVPEDEIAYIHDANTEKQKLTLFSKVCAGSVRFLFGSTPKLGAGTNVQTRLVAEHHLDVPWRPSDIEQREGRIIRQGNMNEDVHINRYVTENTFDAYSWQLIKNKQEGISQVMTSGSPIRSCQDVDEAVFSAAEVMAIASGNPEIKEKMELEIEVARLNVEKAHHDTEQYELQNNLYKRLPVRLLQTKTTIEKLKKDVEYFDTLEKNEETFSIEIGGEKFDQRTAAGIALMSICDKNRGKSEIVVGQYKGFTITADTSYSAVEIRVEREGRYIVNPSLDPRWQIINIVSRINSLPSNLSEKENELAKIESEMKFTEEEIGKPFAKEELLKAKEARLKELEIKLSISGENPSDNTYGDSMATYTADNYITYPEKKGLQRNFKPQKTDHFGKKADFELE